jgi:heat shock protein HslJ
MTLARGAGRHREQEGGSFVVDADFGSRRRPARVQRRVAFRSGGAALALAFAAGAAGGAVAPAAAAGLEGTPWLAVFYAGPGPAGRLLPVLLGTEVTATFQGGVVSGSAGCNTYTAGYALAGGPDALRIGPAATTQMACADPPGVMQQEAAYLAALQRTARYATVGNLLLLQAADGRLQSAYVPRPETSLEGTDWVAVDYNNGRSAVVSVLAGTEITARFAAGSLSGSAGCNTYTAGYTVTAGSDAIAIGPPASTRAFCAEPPGVMDQEAAYLAALPTAARYRIEGAQLRLERTDGARVATYVARDA